MMLGGAVVLSILLPAQDPADLPPRRRVRSEVRIVLEESPEGEYEHDHYEQAWPVEVRTAAGRASSRVTYRTLCRPQEEDRRPIFVPVEPPVALPLSLSVAVSAPRVRVTTSSLSLTTVSGRIRNDPIITSTKPAIFGGGGAGSETSSDAPFLYGPDLDLVLVPDVAGGTSLRIYGRALFGTFEVFDTPTSLQLYGVGPRLSVPVVRTGSLEGAVIVSAGPAFLHTGIGAAVGFDGGVGLRFEQFFASNFSFVAAVEANLYFSKNVSAFGPVVNLGFNLAW